MSGVPGLSMTETSKKSTMSKTERTFRLRDKFSDTFSKASGYSRQKNAEGWF